MKIQRRTVRSVLLQGRLLGKLQQVQDWLTEQMQGDAIIAQVTINQVVEMATRAVFEPGEVDFELPQISDTVDVIQAKLAQFLESECTDMVASVLNGIDEQDRPADAVTAPVPLPEAAEKN